MTESEAIGFVQGKLDCMNKCDIFNKEDNVNNDECDNCEYCYSQGTFGQQKEAFQMAINALEKQIPMKTYHIPQVDDNDNANVQCPMCHATTNYAVNVIKRGHCWNCGQLLIGVMKNEIFNKQKGDYCPRCGKKIKVVE